ncbi:MAG: carboxymuconolactone decarboxylase family protein [Chromatiaceae bacterium]|nr:carboxymuconolactone decarboxylase family protein [Chromatiaceae bacterium]
MKHLFLALFVVVFTTAGAYADEPPNFMKQTYPEAALKAAWEEQKAVFNPNGAIDGKHKRLIALAVSAQVPCEYCVIAQSMRARKAGATEEEIKEALAVAALIRKWSTMLNGYDKYTLEQFKADIGAPTN